eukprot:COSAG05_NODE_24_length_31553_cov_12.138647_16_plen_149_part_00
MLVYFSMSLPLATHRSSAAPWFDLTGRTLHRSRVYSQLFSQSQKIYPQSQLSHSPKINAMTRSKILLESQIINMNTALRRQASHQESTYMPVTILYWNHLSFKFLTTRSQHVGLAALGTLAVPINSGMRPAVRCRQGETASTSKVAAT